MLTVEAVSARERPVGVLGLYSSGMVGTAGTDSSASIVGNALFLLPKEKVLPACLRKPPEFLCGGGTELSIVDAGFLPVLRQSSCGGKSVDEGAVEALL